MKKTKINPDYEVRLGEVSASENRTIEGVAIVYNSFSKPMMAWRDGGFIKFREIIMPNAFDELIDRSDVVALYNHNEETGVLARNTNGTGTLILENTETGLLYRFEAPDTTLGNDTLESIRRRDISKSSFAFTVAKEGQRWEKQTDGTYNRYIDRASGLYDVSMVVRPAYEQTDVYSRSLDYIFDAEKQEEESRKNVDKQELDNYFSELKNLVK